MEGESGVTRSIIEEHQSSDIQGDRLAGESGFIRRIIDELFALNIQGDQV